MPTAKEMKTAEKILKAAAQDAAIALGHTPPSFVQGGDLLIKTENRNENVGMRPALALTAAIIRRAREFKR